MLKKTAILMTAVLIVAGIAVSTTSAEGNATVIAVHGIPGDALGFDRPLPVDVMVTGDGVDACIADFRFGDRTDPISLPEGSYDIAIKLAADPTCSGTTVIDLPGVPLPAGANVTLIAHRTADGTAGAGDVLALGVTASPFPNDTAPVAPGRARAIVHHTAFARTVDVVVSRNYANPNAPGATVMGFTNPTAMSDAGVSQINADFQPGAWQVALELDGAAVFGPDTLNLRPFTKTYIYAVGDFPNTFQYLVFTEVAKSVGSGRVGAGDDEDRPANRGRRRATRN